MTWLVSVTVAEGPAALPDLLEMMRNADVGVGARRREQDRADLAGGYRHCGQQGWAGQSISVFGR